MQKTYPTITAYFARKIRTEQETQSRLAADLRQDEAVFARIRGNVYGIFAAVFSTAVKTAADPMAFLQQKLTDIPASWQRALQQTQLRDDWDAANTERIKLETARKIRTDLHMLQEERHD